MDCAKAGVAMKKAYTAPVLSTKSKTLESLSGNIETARILPLHYFTVASWRSDKFEVLKSVRQALGNIPYIVRSSAINEDTATQSMAGQFDSVLNVCDDSELDDAIEKVISSYGSSLNVQDEILVQPMLDDVRFSGVAFSHDPSTGAKYKVINFSVGANTEAVTAGMGETGCYVVSDGADTVVPYLRPVVSVLDELGGIFSDHPLDVEFAICGDDNAVYVLQVRPLIMKVDLYDSLEHKDLLRRISRKVRSAQQPHPYLHGHSTVFGVMPDWNPAEIIGIRPRPLALTLYKNLVTDSIWAYQRHNYGYRNLRSFPLLVHFAGQPYIDVRLSFNSFIPADIDGYLADQLVDYYINRLIQAPTLHDKVEFEIVFSCYTLDLPERLKVLDAAGFSDKERGVIAESLRSLTNKIIDKDEGLWRVDAQKIEELVVRREKILSSNLDHVSKIYWLLEDCKRYGTLPFAGLARAGFVAVQMLRSLVAVGVFSEDDYNCFMNGLNTVSSQFSRDLSALDKTSFLSRYGHLRPGTYDILSKRYDEAPDEYLGGTAHENHANSNRKTFSLTLDQMRKITDLLKEHGLSCDVMSLFDFIKAGVELREYSKFIFTRSLSDAILLFQSWGKQFGFSEDDLSYADIGCVQDLYASADDPKEILTRSIQKGRDDYAKTRRLWLPPLITKPDDVFSFFLNESEPNFITQSSVMGAVVDADDVSKLPGAIVFISSADPGYDWLFSYPIAGLVTAYGGVNSHMAIRANEMGIPAVIGAGEVLFKRWGNANKIHIDCAGKSVKVVS